MKTWINKSILNKIAVYLIILVSLIIFIYAYISNYRTNTFFYDKSMDLLMKDSEIIGKEIEGFTDKYINTVEQMKTNKDFITILTEVEDRYLKREHYLYDQVVSQLKKIHSTDENISLAFIGLADANDLITDIYEYDSIPEFDLRNRPWYQETLDNDKTSITSPYIDFVTGELIISVATPIYDEENNDIGALAIDIMMDDIYHYMRNYKVGEDGYMFLIQENGTILYHPEIDFDLNIKLPDRYKYHKVVENISNDESIFLDNTNNGYDHYIAYNTIKNTDWVVATVIPKSEVYAPLNNYILINILLFILVIMALAVIIKRATYLINRPLITIAENVKVFKEDDLKIDLPSDYFEREDEIGILSRGLRDTSEQIDMYIKSISSKNKALENEINNRRRVQTKLEMILKLLSNTKEASFILNANFICIYHNKALSDILGGESINLNELNFYENNIIINNNILKNLNKQDNWNGEINIYSDTKKICFLKFSKINYNDEVFYIGNITDLTKFKENEQEIFYFKYFDPITKLQNKVYLEENICKIIENSSPNKNMHSFIILNIDKFRLVNEVKGFEFGNKVLTLIGEHIKSLIGKEDLMGKLNSDEFGIFKTNIKNIDDIYNSILHLSNKLNKVYHIEDEQILINIRMGISLYPNDGESCNTLFNTATSALNNAKQDGFTSYKFYNKELNNKSIIEYELQSKLMNALDNKELFLVYQPQINMKTKEVVGVEALIRWNNNKKIISPISFIPIAEKSGLIIPIGEWILEEACILAKKLNEDGNNIKVSVNISRAQFKKNYLTILVETILNKTELNPKFLKLEITESILMDNEKECNDILEELQNIGVHISIDDFGTGYSSLAYLQKFKVNDIKIDRSFVKDYPVSDNGVIAKTIIELADNLGLNVIAEGVEDDKQESFLLRNNCIYAQGYYYSKPLKENELIEFLDEK